jgi:hypothetical protein
MLPGMPSGGPPPGGPMAGAMAPGMGQSPMGGGAPPAAMRALDQLASAPPGAGEQEMLKECSTRLKAASARVIMRSPRAAQEVAKAAQAVDRALELLEEEKSSSVGIPPDLLGALAPSPMGAPPSGPPGAGGGPMGM